MKLPLLVIPMALFVASPAFAHDQYPARIRDELGLDRKPACTLCHTTTLGMKGTAKQKFAKTLRLLGLPLERDESRLVSILREMDACAIDTDGDEIPDTEEIRNRTNPSDGPATTPTTECGAAAGGAGGGTGRVELGEAYGVEIFTGTLPAHGCALARGSAPALGVGWALVLGFTALFGRVSQRRRRGPSRTC